MVRQPTVATRNRTGRIGRRDGTFSRDAHVHYVRAAKNRHESCRLTAGARSAAREGKTVAYWVEFQEIDYLLRD